MTVNLADIQRAVVANDRLAEEAGLEAWAHRFGVGLEATKHVAQQRAIRAAVVIDGGTLPLPEDTHSVHLEPETLELLPLLTALWIDGFAAGLTITPPSPPYSAGRSL